MQKKTKKLNYLTLLILQRNINEAKFYATTATVFLLQAGLYEVQPLSHCIGNHLQAHRDLAPCEKISRSS